MELSSHDEGEAEIPMPINSAYGGVHGHGHGHGHHHHHGHMTHHHHYPPSSTSTPITPSSNNNITNNPNNSNGGITIPFHNGTTPPPTTTSPNLEDTQDEVTQNNRDSKNKGVVIRYRECQKNHAANMGGNATDGCGEFMPSGKEGTLEALTCSACNCHRNFHRKEIEGHPHPHHHHFNYHSAPHPLGGRKVFLGGSGGGGGGGSTGSGQGLLGYPTGRGALIPLSSRTVLPYHHHHHHVGPLPDTSDQSAEGMMGMMVRGPHGHGHGHAHHQHQHDHHQMGVMKKRFRTKFTQEQKEKMLEFAEKVGWKIQKQEEGVVQQFCNEVGVKRRVLKVWMHNNKHTLAKKNNPIIINNNSTSST